MSDRSSGDPGKSETSDSTWPVEIRGVTESIVTTRGPNGRWNVAALGLRAGDPVTARTYGRTRTWRNFQERASGYVQLTRDAVDFVDAAMAIREIDEPVLSSADAWIRVSVARRDRTEENGTPIVTWALEPNGSAIERETVPTIDRGFAAVVEATVAASRLDAPGYDEGELLDRLSYFATVVESCGGEREQEALDRLRDHVDAEW